MEIQNLEISFNCRRIITSFSYSFEPNYVYLLSGSNGSGKTSILNVIAGVNTKYDGELTGFDIYKKFSVDFLGFDKRISGIKNIKALLMKEKTDTQFLDSLILAFEMEKHISKSVGRMSYGMQKKLSLIASFAAKPDLLLLDEPYNGLDKKGQSVLSYLLHEFILQPGKTVIMASLFENVQTINEHYKIINLEKEVENG